MDNPNSTLKDHTNSSDSLHNIVAWIIGGGMLIVALSAIPGLEKKRQAENAQAKLEAEKTTLLVEDAKKKIRMHLEKWGCTVDFGDAYKVIDSIVVRTIRTCETFWVKKEEPLLTCETPLGWTWKPDCRERVGPLEQLLK